MDAAETVIPKPDVNTSGHFMNSSGQQREREAERVEQGYGDSLAHFRTSSGTRWRPMNPDPPKTVIGPAMTNPLFEMARDDELWVSISPVQRASIVVGCIKFVFIST